MKKTNNKRQKRKGRKGTWFLKEKEDESEFGH